jgi:tocopherol O-methyltransferase
LIFPNQPQSTDDVAEHYDELDRFYREVWGEHVHHGYWTTGRETPVQATEALVDLLAERLQLDEGQSVCDIGCGYGATAQGLADRRGLHVTGLTVSAKQAQRAQERRPAQGSVTVLRQDWLANSFPDASFDRAYSVESSEHMPDKQRFFDEAYRTLKPGGLMVVFAWLACPDPRPWEVRHLLEPICREGRLPSLGDREDYRALGERAGFRLAAAEDLTKRVRRTWSICIQRLLGKLVSQPAYRRTILDAASRNRIFALTLARMMIAYQTYSLRYELLVFAKPQAPDPAPAQ